MRKIRRVDLRKETSTNSPDSNKRSKKVPSQPPRSDTQYKEIINDIRTRNIVLSLISEFQALSGLRYSDASWLRFDDLYRNGEIVDSFIVHQQKIYNKKKTSLINKGYTDEKAIHSIALEASKVTIYVNDELRHVILRARGINVKSEYLFANPHWRSEGLPMDIRSAEYHLKRCEKRLGLNFPLGTHSFRKLFAIKLIAKNTTVEKIRDLLGQKSLDSTNKYLSSIDIDLKKVVEAVSYSG